MLNRFLGWLGVRLEDWRKLAMLAPIFFLCGIAEILTFNGYVSLFNERLGSEYLPYVYMAEAVILPIEAWFLSYLSSKLRKPQLMRILFVIVGIIVSVNAAVLVGIKFSGVEALFFYPILFLTSSFVVRQQTILLWSLAIDLCPTQQAKRLMPMFVSAAALGGIVAGLLAMGVSKLVGVDVVYMLAPLFLLAGSVNYWRSITRYLVPLTLKTPRISIEKNSEQATASFGYIKRSFTWPYMLTALGIMTLMPALYLLMEYVFLNVTREIYPSDSEFASFFGLVTALLFTLALLLQLVSGRLAAWLGPSNMISAISSVFAVGFIVISLTLGLHSILYFISLSFMLLYLLLFYFAEPANQMFFKILPLSQRDGFRYIVQGVSASAGISLGALLQWTHAGLHFSLTALTWIGAALSVVLIALARMSRRLYMKELIHSVKTMISAGSSRRTRLMNF